MARYRFPRIEFVLAAAALLAFPALAADVMRPADVGNQTVDEDGLDVFLAWDAVTVDVAGNPETIDHYNVYRGTAPNFVPDRTTFSNRIGAPTTNAFTDAGVAADGLDYYYLVSAVDISGNEGGTQASKIVTPPVLSGNWTDTSIDLSWADAQPLAEVTTYRVYYGLASGVYEFVDDVGLVNTYSLTGIDANSNWYISVVGVDNEGNESGFSNEHIDTIAGTLTLTAHNEGELCWGASKCTPADPEHIQRSNGFQLLVPADFPEGNWTRVDVTFTMDSRLCDGPPYAPDRCGAGNPVCDLGTNNGTPCASDADCTGGGTCTGTTWNPCGDPWDRTAHLFLVLDDCIAGGGSCITHQNLELVRAITPFGTDAPAPDGRGIVPPRALTMDVTPFVPLMTGRRYVGAHIGHFVPKGWWVTSQFYFSKRPEEVSPKPPADGFQMLFFGGAPPPTATVSIPLAATSVYTRLFTTGHGGNAFCDGGTNNGQACPNGSSDCPGGSCQNCDEFCHRNNQILVDSGVVWDQVPWRDCCYPRGSLECAIFGVDTGCTDWNSCGFPSCSFNRAGWCPGELACHYNLDDGCDQDLDMTPNFSPGATHNVDYNIPINNGSWSVSLALYWYEN